MSNASALIRSLVVYGLCLPLAILLGYMLADPLNYKTLGIVGVVLFTLTLPLLLRWHHAWLITVWNMGSMVFNFLPGGPPAWLIVAPMSFMISLGQYILNRRLKFLHVASVVKPLIFLGAIVFITAKLTGGVGLRIFGGESYGGKRYLFIYVAIVGYFALVARPIPERRRFLYVMLFLLGPLSLFFGLLATLNVPVFYPLLLFFNPDASAFFSMSDSVAGNVTITRLGGLAAVGTAFIHILLARFGVQEVLTLRRPWRLTLFMIFGVISLFGGFRSALIQLLLIFTLIFYLEGLLRSRLTPMLLVAALCTGTLLLPFADRLPLSIQRTISFLPVPVSSTAKLDAEGSSEWRLQMWKNVLPQIPRYLIVGKGYGIDPHELESVTTTTSRTDIAAAGSELAGDYHNGPLSVIVPFGIFGTFAFLWFLGAGIHLLYNNYQYGDPLLRNINRFFFAYFVVKTVMFLLIFGSLYSDLVGFTGVIGLSISLNGGIARPLPVIVPKSARTRIRLPGRNNPAPAGNRL